MQAFSFGFFLFLSGVLSVALSTGCGMRQPNKKFAATSGNACSVCHGNENNAAPPNPLYINGQVDRYAIGAHQAHLMSSIATVRCDECHRVPESVEDHQGLNEEGRVRVVFGPLAKANGANPVWDRSTGTCGSVYCHGSTLPSSSGFNPSWNDVYQTAWRVNGAVNKVSLVSYSVKPENKCAQCHLNGSVGMHDAANYLHRRSP